MALRIRRIVTHPVVKAAYLVLLVAAAAFYLARWRDRLPDLLLDLHLPWAGAAFFLACVSAFLYSYINYDIYHHLGAGPSYWRVFRIVSVSQLGKYLPGKILFAGNFYLFSRAAGIGSAQIAANFAISMALWILTACLCGLPVLGLLDPKLRYLILILPVLLALLVHPRFLDWFLRTVQQVIGRVRKVPLPEEASPVTQAGSVTEPMQASLVDLGVGFYLRVAFLYMATWALAGLGAYYCLRAFAQVGLDVYPLALASIALGTVAGFLVLFAPVGLGIREGIGVLILSPAVGADVAFLSMVLLRGITVVVDLLLALLALMIGGRITAVACGRLESDSVLSTGAFDSEPER